MACALALRKTVARILLRQLSCSVKRHHIAHVQAVVWGARPAYSIGAVHTGLGP